MNITFNNDEVDIIERSLLIELGMLEERINNRVASFLGCPQTDFEGPTDIPIQNDLLDRQRHIKRLLLRIENGRKL